MLPINLLKIEIHAFCVVLLLTYIHSIFSILIKCLINVYVHYIYVSFTVKPNN